MVLLNSSLHFTMSSLLCLTESLLFWQSLPITDTFHLAPAECRVEIRMKTIKEWSENEGKREEEERRVKKKRQGARRKKGDVTGSWWQPIRDRERQRGSQERVCFPRTAASAVKRGHNQSDTELETQEPSGTDNTTELPEDGNPKPILNCRGKWRSGPRQYHLVSDDVKQSRLVFADFSCGLMITPLRLTVQWCCSEDGVWSCKLELFRSK